MDTQFFLELDRPLDGENYSPSLSASLHPRGGRGGGDDEEAGEEEQLLPPPPGPRQTRVPRGTAARSARTLLPTAEGGAGGAGRDGAASRANGNGRAGRGEGGGEGGEGGDKYAQYKLKYMRNLNFNEADNVRERRQRSVSLPVTTSPKGRSVPASGPLAVPAAHEQQQPHALPFGESLPPESVLMGGSFVPPHELVKHDSFSVWQYHQQKKLASKHAV
jgi:hypothetical protein